MLLMQFALASDQELLAFYRKYHDELHRIKPASYERAAVERIVSEVEGEMSRRNLSCDHAPTRSQNPLTASRVLRVVGSPLRTHKPPR